MQESSSSALRGVFSLSALVLVLIAAGQVLRLAYADRLSRSRSPEVVAAAVRLSPGNSEYWKRWADLLEAAGQDAKPALESAAALNPNDASVWIRLGLDAEAKGDFALAEQRLSQAATVSLLFQPSWTLANYHFRRGDVEQFWPWVKDALSKSYGDPTPLFRLCWRASNDPDLILYRGIPARQPVLSQYLAFLTSEKQLAAVEPVAYKAIQYARREDLPALFAYCDRLIEAGNSATAVGVWNSLSARKLIPYSPLDPEQGASLTNGAFSSVPISAGFDWRLPTIPGVYTRTVPVAGYVRIDFSGRHPETCEPLEQFLPVTPGARYRLRFSYETFEVPPESGLQWRVFDAAGNEELRADSPQLSSDQWTTGSVSFSSPAGRRLVRLVLSYRRTPGTTRFTGSVSIRDVGLERAP